MEQGDVAGGEAHLRVGRVFVYLGGGGGGGGGGVGGGVGGGGGVVYDGGGVYSRVVESDFRKSNKSGTPQSF